MASDRARHTGVAAEVSGPLVLDVLRALRPKQWIKNGFVFAALIFAGKVGSVVSIGRTLAAFALFCALSSGMYLINDLADRQADRLHPLKRNRPIAAGRVSARLAAGLAVATLAIALVVSFSLAWKFGLIALAYVLLTSAYTWWLKHLVLIDVFALAGGFVLRAAGGAVVIGVGISPWLYLCTVLLSLFLGFGKRRHELLLLEAGAGVHRRNLEEYTAPLLDDLINIVAGATIIAYALYTFFATAVPQNHAMMITIPFVLYGIFRYLLLVHRTDMSGAPEEAVWRDRPLLGALVVWTFSSVAILHLFK